MMNDLKARQLFYCLDEFDKFGNPLNLTVYNGGQKIKKNLELMFRACTPTLRGNGT